MLQRTTAIYKQLTIIHSLKMEDDNDKKNKQSEDAEQLKLLR